MKLAGMDGKTLADKIGIHQATFYRKMAGETGWTTREASLICLALRLEDDRTKVQIFLNE